MKRSLLLGAAVAPFLAVGQDFLPIALPANTTTAVSLPETAVAGTPSSSVLFTSSDLTPIVAPTSSDVVIPETTTEPGSIIEPVETLPGTPIVDTTPGFTTETPILAPSSDSTTLPESTSLAPESSSVFSSTAILSDTTTPGVIIEPTTETSLIQNSDSTTLPETTSLTSAAEETSSVTITDGPTQTSAAATQTDEAKDAVNDAYGLMGIFVNDPTQENAQKAKDSTDNALGLVIGIGGGVPGFGALITSLGGAASSLAGAISTPAAAVAAVTSAMSQVKQDLDDTNENEDEDKNSTEENEQSTTQDEASSTTEATTTEETTTATSSSEYLEPTFAYDYVTEAAGGSDDIASALAESQVPELGCMSVFQLPITACAMQTGGGLATETPSSTATSAESSTAISGETTTPGSEESTTVISSDLVTLTSDLSTPAPSTFVTVTRTPEQTSDSTTLEPASSSTAIEPSETPVEPSETPVESTETSSEFVTTTAESTTDITTTEAPERTYYPCVNHGGPNVPTPYCQCSTTTAGQTFFATASLISGQCASYTAFPSEIATVTTEVQAPITEGPVAEPVTMTEDGVVLSYPSRVYSYGEVYTGIKITLTYGAGTPVTLSTPAPTQTDANNKGSSQCHSVDDACQRAYEQFEDDTIYTDYVSRYSRIKSGIIVAATFGQAGCTAQFKCDDYGIGMSGRLIKDAVQYMKDNNGVSKCGTAYLSNTCQITLNYCTNCHHDG